MNFKNAFWGILFIGIGSLFLLKNLDIIYFSWWDIWHLWPVLLVFIGISVLPVKAGIKILLSVITIAIAAAILISNPTWSHRWPFQIHWESAKDRPIENQRIFEEYDAEIKEAELDFDAAAGEFEISGTTTNLFEFEKSGNLGKYMYSIKDLDDRKEISISLEKGISGSLRLKNEVKILLNNEPVWDLNIDVGAADINMDLSDFKIRKVTIDGGASAIDLILGDLFDYTEVDIDAGASSIEIDVPETIACEVKSEAVLSSRNLEGFNKVSSGTYVTDNFSEAKKNIVINIDVAVSSIHVRRY